MKIAEKCAHTKKLANQENRRKEHQAQNKLTNRPKQHIDFTKNLFSLYWAHYHSKKIALDDHTDIVYTGEKMQHRNLPNLIRV